MKKERVKLTAAEKSELFAEGVITVVLLLLLNLSIIILIVGPELKQRLASR